MRVFVEGWYLIYTRPCHEKKVHQHLAEREIKSFLPTKKSVRVWHDRRKLVDEPLFPSYIFIYLATKKDYYDGLDANGTLYYVRTGKEIARVSESVIRNIQIATEGGTEIEIMHGHIQPGQRLQIREGALAGLCCEVVEVKGRQQLLVRMDMLQRNILVTLPADHLLPCKYIEAE